MSTYAKKSLSSANARRDIFIHAPHGARGYTHKTPAPLTHAGVTIDDIDFFLIRYGKMEEIGNLILQDLQQVMRSNANRRVL